MFDWIAGGGEGGVLFLWIIDVLQGLIPLISIGSEGGP